MTDLRTPEEIDPDGMIREDELVPADDSIIGRAFLWSMLVFVVIGVAIGGVMWSLGRKPVVEAIKPATFVPPKSIDAPNASLPAIPFVDITEETGIDFIRDNGATGDKLLPETMGGGCAFLDYDNDGDQDLILINAKTWDHSPNRLAASPPVALLYRNGGRGHFTNVSSAAGLNLSAYGMGVVVGDYDNDGDPDIFITTVGRNHLLQNNDGVFWDVTDTAGVGGDEHQWFTSAGFCDYDRDGDLDLFVCNYVKWSRAIDFAVNYQLTGIGRAYGPPTNFEGTNNILYRNNGDGTFSDVSAAAGMQVKNPATGAPMGKALGVVFVDPDDDGFLDILVANDTVQKFFFHNQRDGTFKEIGATIGVAFDRNGAATGAMGVDEAHHRNDAALALAIGNFANEMTSLYVTQGDPMRYADEAITEGIGAPSRLMLTFGVFFFDADLDGRLDFLQCNGHIEDQINIVQPSQHYEQPGQLFWNAGPSQKSCFAELPRESVGDLSRPIVGRGAAYADIDGDGDLDVLLTQPRGKPMLLRNDQANSHHWLRIKLIGNGTTTNRDAIGAKIELTANGITQRRTVSPTRSYLSQVELPVTFGLGDAAKVDVLKITWPDGTVQNGETKEVDRLLTISQAVR